jgi:Fe-S-cluster containining protein
LNIDIIRQKLEEIYSLIPEYSCNHCHKCCSPIVWFEPEEIIIKDYLKKNNLDKNSFLNKTNKCSFLKNDRCAIYPVRPIVCRLQAVTSDLPCHFKKTNNYLSEKEIKNIKDKFNKILDETKSKTVFYTNRKNSNL